MENAEVEKCVPTDEGSQLNRNRSFKSKQLVRSQAIRESTSPPRTISPSVRSDDSNSRVNAATSASQASDSSHEGEVFGCDKHSAKQRVEIQITPGSWEPDQSCVRRSRRWPPGGRARAPRDLLSNNPRVTCVCGACSNCPQCRGRRRRHKCPTKQDSGIVCSEDCPDCSDSEQNGSTNDLKKSASGSIETEEQDICRCADRKEKPKSISLNTSRSDSDDKSEPAGPELVAFIKETLNKNARDRTTLLTIERELHNFINDPGRCIVKFPVMTSYGRMLVHRCAALFQLAHHLDQANKTCVIVSKSGTCGGRVPCTSFKSWCEASLPPSPARHVPDQHHAKSILKRDTHSLDEPASGGSALSRSKSLEQREKDYERVRRRIFSSDEATWPWLNTGAPVKLLAPEPGRNKLLKVQSLENPSVQAGSWRGTAVVSKSHSFGGYGDQPQPRALSTQGNLASSSWRLSPSSSGYKTLSVRSTDSLTPSPTGGGTPEPATVAVPPTPAGALVWAVTDLAAVPRGAVVIHPQSGRPLTNPDGSVYHFDPNNPPVFYDPNIHNDGEHDKIDPNNEKRRGRLEKQHSFMDNENECQSSENCHNKCCCGCRKEHSQQQQPQQRLQQNLQQQNETLPLENTMEKETSKPPPSPIKYENPIQNHTADPTNHSKPPETVTYHKPPDVQQDQTANERFESQISTNKSYETANQREAVKINQDIVHYSQPYVHTYNGEEMSTPPQMHPYLQEMALVSHGKVTPVVPDPNIRPISLSSMMYPAAIPQGYPAYIPNHRLEQLNQPMYQPVVAQIEEPKQISTSPQQQESTFRIDPSYPFQPVEYAYCDPVQLQHQPTQQRSYSMPYNQMEVPAIPTLMPPAYPPPNVLLPPPIHQYPLQYQEQLQWAQVQPAPKLYDVCPVVYPHHYTHYNVVYPQMVPQAYPLCQPVYPVLDNKEAIHQQRKRTSLPPTTRNTPLAHTPDDKKHEEKELNRQDSTDIAAKIQQIKEQMAALKTRGGAGTSADTRREGAWRRNSGHGILGHAPQHYQQRQNDENQLSTAARDIINSLRHMQAKNTYQQERRFENQPYNNRSYERNDNYRGRRHDGRDAGEPHDRGQGTPVDRPDMTGKGDAGKLEPRPRVNINLPHRPHLYRQMSPGTWCRRSPAPVHTTMNHPRRPHPDNRPRR